MKNILITLLIVSLYSVLYISSNALISPAFVAAIGTDNTGPTVIVLNSTADTYVRSGQANKNDGGSQFVRVQNSGSNRSLVQFATPAFHTDGTSDEIISVKLRLTITDNNNNWGSTGRTLDLHRMIQAWSEGNGDESSRGAGLGATWNCATDTNISNQAADCTGADDWDMTQPASIWVSTPTATTTISNGQSGVVEFDVTDEVKQMAQGLIPNKGWILKKTLENKGGSIDFGSRESTVKPELVVTYN